MFDAFFSWCVQQPGADRDERFTGHLADWPSINNPSPTANCAPSEKLSSRLPRYLGNLRNLAIAELRAATDSLTGLPNKRGVEDTVKRMVAQSLRSGVPLTALMGDLDHFKSVNDRHGHGRGDEVLAAVGAVFGDTLRAGDFAGRYGGEEFLVLVPDAGGDSGLLIAERIRAGVAALHIASVTSP
jgi:diguanylate cyclase (GGDEF)-like protein